MHKRTKLYMGISLVCVGLLLVGGFALGRLRDDQSSNPSSVAETTAKKSTNVAATVQIKLPGAKPIDALVEDYNLPTSMWVVVSKDYPLSEQQYYPKDLELTALPARSDKSIPEKSVRKVIVPALTAFFTDAKAAGNDIMIASGFRSYDLQQTYFTSYSKSYGVEAANKFSARPGQSEHQTGLALDIAYENRDCYLDVCFGQKPAGLWLAANAYKYGFVLRYPADKTDITKYQYEPWHFRYVGKPLAAALHESGLTLDEARPYLQTALKELKAQHKI